MYMLVFVKLCFNLFYYVLIFILLGTNENTNTKGVKSGVPERQHFLPHMWYPSLGGGGGGGDTFEISLQINIQFLDIVITFGQLGNAL